MADIDYSTLAKIITKVRRLTRSPSQTQITDANIKDYINTFVIYDFPEQVKEITLRKTLSFFTDPYIDTYQTDSTNVNSPLYNFKNRYISVNPPIFIAGNISRFSQDESQFYSLYPKTNFIEMIGTGDGITVNYAGTLTSVPVLQRSLLISAIGASYSGIKLIDNPVNASLGNLCIPNDLTINYGTINYVTGAYNITLPAAPLAGTNINAEYVPYVVGQPSDVLYYDNKFVVRPVPDQAYRIDISAYIRPDELLVAGNMPELAQWWQYIAYGAAKKVFEDRMDQESIQAIMSEFKEQETLLMRRTISQQSSSRVPTIYSEGLYYGPGGVFGNNGYF